MSVSLTSVEVTSSGGFTGPCFLDFELQFASLLVRMNKTFPLYLKILLNSLILKDQPSVPLREKNLTIVSAITSNHTQFLYNHIYSLVASPFFISIPVGS